MCAPEPGAGRRLLSADGWALELAPDATVVRWRAPEPAMPPVVSAGAGAGCGLRAAVPVAAELAGHARTVVQAPCGAVEVRDALVVADEPVGRARPGVALVRLVRGLDHALDVEHWSRLGGDAAPAVRWRQLNRLAIGHLAGRKVTVDAPGVSVAGTTVTARLRAAAGSWVALTIAVDGHLPADAEACRRVLGSR